LYLTIYKIDRKAEYIAINNRNIRYMNGLKISLDQWQALVAVVEADGYAQAAAQLHKTQSTVSYAVKKIEEQMGLRLFQIQGRKAVLTAEGQALYRRGKALIDEAARVERSALNLAAGNEAQIAIAAEIIFPTWLLLQCMERFAREQPLTRIELYESVLSGTKELLMEGRVDLAIASQVPPGFLGDLILQVRFIAAAAPSHPLHQLGRELTLNDLREHRHLIIRDSGTSRSSPLAWQGAEQRWTVSQKATSIRAACMGLGFAWFAEEIIRDEIKSGQLIPLPLAEGAERMASLYLVYADPFAKGPGVRRLGELVREAVAEFPDIVNPVGR
jgi:DNA-binding transcriptional LysR family regulator